MEDVPETTIVRHGILKSYFRSVLVILFLVILMMIIMVLPVNTTLKMSFAGSLLFLIVYGIACVVQANLAGLVIQTSVPQREDVEASLNRTVEPRARSPVRPPHRTQNVVQDQAGSPSRIAAATRQGHRHHHHKHRTNELDDLPPDYEKIDFTYQPEYLPTSANPFCDPPPYPTTPPEPKPDPTISRV